MLCTAEAVLRQVTLSCAGWQLCTSQWWRWDIVRGGELEAQELGLCSAFSAELLPLSSSTTLQGALAQSSHSHPCHPGLAGPGAGLLLMV